MVWRIRRRSWGYRGCGFKTGSLQVWGLKQCKIEGVKWCKSWAAKGGKIMYEWGCSGLHWEDFSGIIPDWNCYVRVGCNGLQWEDFSGITPDWNCHVRVGCNGLQREDFSGINPWLKLLCKSALQWEDCSVITPPWLKMQCNSGLQWAEMGGLFRNYSSLPWLKLRGGKMM